MDQELAQIAVAALADAKQPGFAARAGLPRDQSQPRREIAASGKSPGITHGRYKCRDIEDANSGDRRQSSCRFFGIQLRSKLMVECFDPPRPLLSQGSRR